MDDHKQPQQAREPELMRPDEAIKDLEPDEQEGEAVKGGTFLKIRMETPR